MFRFGARLATAVALFVGLAAGTACSSGHASAPDDAAISAVLSSFAGAARAGDTASAAADLDTGSAAAAFHDRERGALDALHQLPIQAWSYQLTAPVTDDAALTAASHRYGTPARIVQLTLRYQLRGVDAVPVVRQLWWTFVSRDGHARIAGDDDLATSGGRSWHGPWDFGPVVVRRSATSLIIAPSDDAAALAELATRAATAVTAVTGVWGAGWPRQVAVVVPADSTEAAALGADGGTVADVAAETAGGQRDPASGTVSGVFVVLNPATYDRLDPTERTRVLTHETTHVASATDTGDGTPRWLVEGLAEYASRLADKTPVATAAPQLATAVRAGHGPAQLPDDAAFTPGSDTALSAYQQAWLACRLIAQRAGTAGLLAVYRSVGTSPYGAEQAEDTAFSTVLHESTAAFTAQWQADLRTELAA